MEWLHQPSSWSEEDQIIGLMVEPKTDFWRKTHDGHVQDNGHFYYQQVEGDFQSGVKVSGQYHALYDHAGLMVRLDEANWFKCDIELINGLRHCCVVVTRDYSDLSLIPLPATIEAVWLRIQCHDLTYEVSYSLDGENYTLMRQAYLAASPAVAVGLMAASPLGEGFPVTFEGFAVHKK